MRTFLFCTILFALLQNAYQVSLRIHNEDAVLSFSQLRRLEFDTETSFPIVEAVKILLGEWTFWVTLILFAGVVFVAWKEKRLGKWERVGAYIIFGGLVFFSYLAIPFIIGLGVYCFRDFVKNLSFTSTTKHFENGTEMTERFIPNKIQEFPKTNKLLSQLIPKSGKSKDMTKSFIKKLCNCFVTQIKESGKDALTQGVKKINTIIDPIGDKEEPKQRALPHPLGTTKDFVDKTKPVNSKDWDKALKEAWSGYERPYR